MTYTGEVPQGQLNPNPPDPGEGEPSGLPGFSQEYINFLNSEVRIAFHRYTADQQATIREVMRPIFTSDTDRKNNNDTIGRWMRENPSPEGRQFNFIGSPNPNTYPQEYQQERRATVGGEELIATTSGTRKISTQNRMLMRVRFAEALIEGARSNNPGDGSGLQFTGNAREVNAISYDTDNVLRNKMVGYLLEGQDIFNRENRLKVQFFVKRENEKSRFDVLFMQDGPEDNQHPNNSSRRRPKGASGLSASFANLVAG